VVKTTLLITGKSGLDKSGGQWHL